MVVRLGLVLLSPFDYNLPCETLLSRLESASDRELVDAAVNVWLRVGF